MIEVTLLSKADKYSNVSRFVSRKRFNPEVLGVGINEVVKGFLRANLDNLESSFNNVDLVNFLNSESSMTNKDLMSIKYALNEIRYDLLISFVADDEENSTEVPDGTIEYNVIDSTFLQKDYPTVTKISVPDNTSIGKVLESVVLQSGLFDEEKLGIKNPFRILINNMKDENKAMGSPNGMIVSRVLDMLNSCGITIQAVLPSTNA